MKPNTLPPALKKGERFRFEPGGQLYEVARVSPGGAYPFKVFDPPRLVTFKNKAGEEVTVLATRGAVEAGISLHSFVIREEKT